MAKRKAQPDEIDLHGLRHKPALELVRKTLDERYSSTGSFSLTIITGNSTYSKSVSLTKSSRKPTTTTISLRGI